MYFILLTLTPIKCVISHPFMGNEIKKMTSHLCVEKSYQTRDACSD